MNVRDLRMRLEHMPQDSEVVVKYGVDGSIDTVKEIQDLDQFAKDNKVKVELS